MSDASVSGYSEPPREVNPYAEGWREGVIAMETWTLEQGLDRKTVHNVAVQIMHSAVTKEERRATKYGEYQSDIPADDSPVVTPREDFTGPEWQDRLPDGVELEVVDTDIVPDDDASVDVMALAQQDMAAAEARDEELPPFEQELSSLINRYSGESVSGTPDFILAKFLQNTLKEFNEAVSHRAWWRGEFVDFKPGRNIGYSDEFTGQKIESPSEERVKRYQETGNFETYEQWQERIASQK